MFKRRRIITRQIGEIRVEENREKGVSERRCGWDMWSKLSYGWKRRREIRVADPHACDKGECREEEDSYVFFAVCRNVHARGVEHVWISIEKNWTSYLLKHNVFQIALHTPQAAAMTYSNAASSPDGFHLISTISRHEWNANPITRIQKHRQMSYGTRVHRSMSSPMYIPFSKSNQILPPTTSPNLH